MVTVETLEALDLLIWVGNGVQAGELACCNQSTVSRRIRQAQATFKLNLLRVAGAWQAVGDPLLLSLEREVHQLARFMGRQGLRLQAPIWSSEALLQDLPSGWIRNPLSALGSPHHCLELLEQRVIDACLATLPERPAGDDPRFACFDLFHSPIHLVTTADTALSLFAHPTREEIGSWGSITTFPFNPRPQQRFIRSFYAHHFRRDQPHRAGRQAETHPVYFANSLMLKVLGDRMPLVTLDVDVPSHYVESLVVLREHRETPAVAELVEVLRRRIQQLSRAEPQLTAIA